MLNVLRKRAERRRLSESLVRGLVAQSRQPWFYERLRVADTIDGRFDLMVLHAWLVLDRLDAVGERALSQTLVDDLFVQFDEALRQQGAGDIGMSRRMTKMADAFYGRLKAYREASGEAELATAFVRNVYRGDVLKLEEAKALAIYAASARARLAELDLTADPLDFGTSPNP